MFKLYKIIFISDIDEKQYVIYCNKNNLPIALKQVVEEYAGYIVFFFPCVFTLKTFRKCKNLLTTLR